MLRSVKKFLEGDKGVKERSFQIDRVPKVDYFYFTKNDYNVASFVLRLAAAEKELLCVAAEKEYVGIHSRPACEGTNFIANLPSILYFDMYHQLLLNLVSPE